MGSGFSSAVMLDTMDKARLSAAVTFIEPYPDRLYSLFLPNDRSVSTVIARPVQEVPLSIFDQLEAQDLLFIDSSHVAKIGSDVTLILLRILPRLKRGVLVHFHDIFYPCSYPAVWIREGRAWNESSVPKSLSRGKHTVPICGLQFLCLLSFPGCLPGTAPCFPEKCGLQFMDQEGGLVPVNPMARAAVCRAQELANVIAWPLACRRTVSNN